MTKDNMRVFVTSNMKAVFSCPKCSKSQHQDVSRFVGHDSQVKLKCKCTCKHTFSVTLERRQSIRKEVSFQGHIADNHPKGYQNEIIIRDLSKNGLRIETMAEVSLNEGEKIKLEFRLDDPDNSNISKEVRIKKKISSTRYGCEFLSKDHYGPLGRYFFSRF